MAQNRVQNYSQSATQLERYTKMRGQPGLKRKRASLNEETMVQTTLDAFLGLERGWEGGSRRGRGETYLGHDFSRPYLDLEGGVDFAPILPWPEPVSSAFSLYFQ